MNLSAPFIARPIGTWLLALGVLLCGLLGYVALPVAALPQVDFPVIEVTTQLPGASADVVATLITASLERELGQIPGLAEMSSISAEGSSQITLRFQLHRPIDSAAQDVQAAINAASATLPANLPYPPTYARINPADAPIMTIALQSTTIGIDKLSDAADTLLQQQLSEIEGVGKVTVLGNMKPAIRVHADPARLAAYGLSMEDVRAALAAANVDGAKGGLDGARQATMLSANDQLLSPAGYDDMIIAWRNTAPVRLRDVGGAAAGLENDRVAAWYQGEPAVVLDIQRQPGANILATVDRLRAELPALEAALPAGIHLAVVSDRTAAIRASIHDVQYTLLLSVILVVLVIFAFLRGWRATLIPAIAMPLSLVATFGVMALCGFSLDNLSLMALTVASGFVVDDAIVMIENIVRHIEGGTPPLEAAFRGARQIGFTIVSLTVSLIAVFIPLLFMTGVIGRLFAEFSITLSVSVIVSAVVSLTLTPMLCGRLLRAAPAKSRAPARIVAFYGKTVRWTLRRPSLMILFLLVTIAISAELFSIIPKGFLPAQDDGVLVGITEAAPSISIPAMTTLQARAAAVIAQDAAVDSVVSVIGAGGINPAPNTGRLTIVLKPRASRVTNLAAITARLQSHLTDIPGLRVYLQPVQDIQIGTRISRTQFQYTMVDTDRAELATWAPRLLAAMRASPALRDVASDAQDDGLRSAIHVDRQAAMRLGVSMQTIQDVLYDSFGQRQISTIYGQNNQYRIILEADPAWLANPAAPLNIRVPGAAASSGGGAQVPLSAIATLEQTTAPLTVTHLAQFPAITLSFNLADGASLGQAVAAVAAAEQDIGLPRTITGHFSGDAAEFQTSLASEPWLIGAALVVIYIVLGVLYESALHPITILSTLPSAGVGALAALMLCGLDLSLVALIGIVLLMGIVKKNAIMMIDFAIDAQRMHGLSPEAAILEACLLRFRPIMMTTMAALLGALPLVFDHGNGSELRFPLGVTIVGGLILSQFLTLYTTPAIYLVMEQLRRKLTVQEKKVVFHRVEDAPSAR